MTAKELFEIIKDKISKLKPGELLKLDKEAIKNKVFGALLDLLNQKSLEIGGPKIEYNETTKIATLTLEKDEQDPSKNGYLNIWGTASANFVAEIWEKDGKLVFKITATLDELSLAGLTDLDLIDPNTPDLNKLPAITYGSLTLSVSTANMGLTIEAKKDDTAWPILGLNIFKLKDLGINFTTQLPEDSKDRVSTLAIKGSLLLGQTEVKAGVTIPLGAKNKEAGKWKFDLDAEKALKNTFNDLVDLLYSNTLQNYIPIEILSIKNDTEGKKGIFLKQLDVKFSTEKAAVESVLIVVNAKGNVTIANVEFTDADVNLDFTPAKAKGAMNLAVKLKVKMAISGQPVDLDLKIPSVNGEWTLISTSKPSPLSVDAMATIPGSASKEEFKLPDELKKVATGLTLEKFESVFNPSAASWKQVTLNVKYDKAWHLVPGVLEVKTVSLNLDATKAPKTGKTTTTGSFNTKLAVGGEAGFEMELIAAKKGDDWTYKAKSGQIKLKKMVESLLGTGELGFIPEVNVDSVELNVDQTKKTYDCAAKVSGSWKPFGDAVVLKTAFVAKIKSERPVGKPVVNTGTIEGIVSIDNVDAFKNSKLKLSYNLKDDKYSGEFEGIKAEYNKKKNEVTFNLGNLSLGSIITKMISWVSPGSSITLEDPWTILNDINLKDLNFKFNLEDKSFGFEYKPGSGLNLGIASINGIKLNYAKKKGEKEYKLKIELDGQLIGKPIPAWDLLDPKSAPKVPGKGDSKFDLEYLAMGQRVSLKDTTDIHNMDGALDALQNAFKEPKEGSDDVPINKESGIVFNENANWMIGAKFTIMNTVELGVIFNDPQLYGLLVRLKGEKAKMFKGLEFQIIYKKISDTIGVYEIELKLPDAMRNLEFGAVSVTLPVIGLQVYTNGNFRIDIGFPWNGDFTRSFTVQAFPFIGSGGFYFAWLSAETATNVPAITSGNFSPVIEFGLGFSLGLGKTFEKGILSGGLSLQVRGILQGVIGFYNPNPDKTGAIVKSDANYYAVQGTLEIVGRLYGNINFAIVKASLDITVHILAKVMFISYEPIDIYLEAGIRVRLTIEIDLGLFSINIHFSFDATIKEHFQVGQKTTPPWTLAQKQPARLLRSKHGQLFRSSKRAATAVTMKWEPIKFATEPVLNIFFMPSLTAAAGADAKQAARYMTMLYIETENPTVDPAQNTDAAASFTTLAKSLLVWAINANQDKGWQTDQYDEIVGNDVTLAYLQNCYDYLAGVKDVEIPLDDINAFLSAFDVRVSNYIGTEKLSAHGSIFPMFPLLTLKAELNKTPYGKDVDFETFTRVNDTYKKDINAYFEKLAVDYQNPLEADHHAQPLYKNEINKGDKADPSMAAVIYQDYFLMMAKAALGEAIDLMKAFPYAYNNETLSALSQHFGVHEEVILQSNQAVALAPTLVLNIGGVYAEILDDSLTDLEENFDVPVARIMGFNRTNAAIIKKGVEIKALADEKVFTTDNGTTIQQLATYFKTEGQGDDNLVADLVANTDIAGLKHLFLAGSKLLVEPVEYTVVDGDTIISIVGRYKEIAVPGSIDIYTFAELNSITAGMFIAGSVIFIKQERATTAGEIEEGPYTITGSDTILSLAQKLTEGNIYILMDLLTKSNQALLLQPQATVFIPEFKYQAKETETLESVLNQFSLTADTLIAANQDVQNIWPQGAELIIPGIAQAKISDITGLLAAKGKFNNLSGMASRFLLHGLRLPASASLRDVKLLAAANWETKLETKSLYDLTGQGLELPAFTEKDEFTIILEKNPSASFIDFQTQSTANKNGLKTIVAAKAGNKLVVDLSKDDITQISNLVKTVLDPEVPVIREMQPYVETGRKFNFSNFTQWNYGSTEPMWPDQPLSVVPSIWQIPSNLLQAAFSSQKLVKPLVTLVTAKQDAPNRPVKTQPVTNYSWSLSVPLSISRVPSALGIGQGEMTPNIYQLNGTDEVGMIFLERLIRYYNALGKKVLDKVHVLYPPNPADNKSGSLLSNDPASVTSFIVKTNFSTESNPLQLLKVGKEPVKIQSIPEDFAEMVWQASVVKSGGFYLYYAFNGKEELPASLFTNDNTADIRLVFTFNDNIKKDEIHDFMNSVAVGENINPANVILSAIAQEQQVANVKFGNKDSFQTIANRYNISIDDLGHTLSSLKISDNLTQSIPLTGLIYEVKPGDTFTAIAAYFAQGQPAGFAELVNAANPGLKDEDYAKVWTLVNIPAISLIPGKTPAGANTLAAVAVHYHISVSRVAHLFKDVEGFLDGEPTFALKDKMTERNAVIQPGTIGVELQRIKPAAVKSNDQYLENAFSLLGIKIAPNTHFDESGEGLPAGFNDFEKPKRKGLPKGVEPDDLWNFQRILPVAPYARVNSMTGSGAPDELIKTNPYAGVGNPVQINMNWLDVFGNRTVDPFSYPADFAGKSKAPLNRVPLQVSYTDQLISIDKWPGFSANYAYHQDNNEALLSIIFNFDVSKYVVYKPLKPQDHVDPDDQKSKTKGQKFEEDMVTVLDKVKADHQTYKNIIYQLWQGDISVTLHDTLSGNKRVLDTDGLTGIRTMVNAIYQYLGSLIEASLTYSYYAVKEQDICENTFATAKNVADIFKVDVDQLISINQGLEHPFLKTDDYEIIIPKPLPAALMLSGKCADANPEQIFELAVDLTISRNNGLVNEAFIDVAGVGTITAVLKPVSTAIAYAMGHFNKEMDGEGKQLSLHNFAGDFENAYHTCKIATGTSVGNLLANDKEKQLWVVRWGEKGIQFDIKGQPVYFSPAPLANYLLNFSGDKAISIRAFDPAKGLDNSKVTDRNYGGINLDEWASRFLAAVDNFLMPQYAIPAFILDQNYKGDKSLKKIQDAKQVLAAAITSGLQSDKLSSRITNVLNSPDYSQQDLDTAAEKLRQSLLIKLTNAYKADTVVLFKTEIRSSYVKTPDFIPPNIYGQPLVPGMSTTDQLYSMSAAKIPLNNGASDMAFIFGSQNREATKSLKLDLAYQVTHIEYDIKPVHVLHPDKASVNADYNASTWLSFVIPPVQSSIKVTPDSSTVNIPVPLKVYPAPPSVVAQDGKPSSITGERIKLGDLLLWDYEYVYEQMESAQDSIDTRIQFNNSNKLRLPVIPKEELLFANLAQFIEVYADIEKILSDKLVTITPLSKTEDLDQVRFAVKAFAEIADMVAHSWQDWRKPAQTFSSRQGDVFNYHISEIEDAYVKFANDPEKGKRLLLKIEPGNGGDMPWVQIDGFKTVELSSGQYAFEYLDITKGQWLLYDERNKYNQRKLKLRNLNVLTRQNAWSHLSKVRNLDLVANNQTNTPFIYRTPEVSFANMMVPYLDTINYEKFKAVNIAQIDNTAGQKRSLENNMLALFRTLFENSAEINPKQTIKIELSYRYTLGEDADSMVIVLPVTILPPYEIDLRTDLIITEGTSFIAKLSNAMHTWFTSNDPVTTNADFLVDVSVYSGLNMGSLPLLRIRELFLKIVDIAA